LFLTFSLSSLYTFKPFWDFMKIVYSWLKEFVDIDIPAQELADALTGAGLEVASVQTISIPDKIKVARILETNRHPNADRLTVCKVDIGDDNPLTIVCGAPNTKPGMLAPLAVIGAALGPDFVVTKAKLRGVESFGMLCSERELGLSDDHSGILSLPSHCKVGAELSEYYPEDAVIEIEITPQRGDCLSMIGVAREVAARFGLPLKETALRPLEKPADPVADEVSVTIEDAYGCPRYAGRLVRGITLSPSPEWMQRRLTLAGLRPINCIVDITNYMLLHFGQPMHAFDFDRIRSKRIIVKKAGKALAYTTLDAVERKLTADDLVICDGEGPVAIAGIMGGAGSEISGTTTDVFLECAFFNQTAVRKTSKRLGLSTDSSYRFERGVDPETGLIDALDTAAALIAKLGNGTVCAGRIDLYPKPFEKKRISVRATRTGRVLGRVFSLDQIRAFLSSLGLSCVQKDADTLECLAPLFRHDLTGEEDLIEEVGRLYGYDHIAASTAAQTSLYVKRPFTEENRDSAREALASAGLSELMTNSFTSEKRRALLTPEIRPVVLLNPLSPDMAQMRTTLAGSMLDVLNYNLNRKNGNNKLFEFGKVFTRTGDGENGETQVLGIIIEGNWLPASWNTRPLPCDIYIVKGLLASFAARIGIPDTVIVSPAGRPAALYGQDAVSVTIGTVIKGTAGAVSPKVLDLFDIQSSVYFAELDVTQFLNTPRPRPRFKPLPKFPALERDFCFVVPEKISAGAIAEEIKRLSTLIETVRPFDLYRGEKLGAGVKSIAVSVGFRSNEKTLTDKEAESVSSKIIGSMEELFGAKLRT
jgi:phenylalanyl-tRNA synthetase beta chain